MKAQTDLLVFTDLDGTLIDHDTYDWAPAQPALKALQRIGAGVILASSKTAAEITVLRADMGLQAWPALVENGAGILDDGVKSKVQTRDYDRIRAALAALPTGVRKDYRGFGDMTSEEVSRLTGLTLAQSDRAKTRCYSEPGLWHGSEDGWQVFESALRVQGVYAREGGRFLTLSFGRTKADAMADIIARYKPTHTIALGDAPNDVEMLEAADHGVIVANPNRAPLPRVRGEDTGRILRTDLPGPHGWNTAILKLLKMLNLTKD